MALEALDSVDEPSEGGGGLPAAAPPVQVAQAPAKSPYTIGKLPGTVPVGSSVLEQMQQLLAERQAQKAAYSNYVEDAVAAAMDPEYRLQAMAQRQNVKSQRDQDIFQMQNQIAQFQAAQEQAKRQAASLQGLLGGAPDVGAGAPSAGAAGAGGVPAAGGITPLPPDVRAEMQRRMAMGDNAGAEQVFNKWRETSMTQRETAVNRAESYKRDIPIRLEGTNDFVMVDALTAAALRTAGRDTISREQYDKSQGFGAPAAAPAAPAPAAPAAPAPAAPAAAPVSVRNNNPGNLVGSDGKIMTFRTPEEGVAALQRDLQGKLSGQSPAYQQRFGNQPVTPARLAEVWAPAAAPGNTAESTANYGKHIAKKLGIKEGDPIPNTPDALQRVQAAITEFESGNYGAAPAAAPAAAAKPATGGAKTYESVKAEREMERSVEEARQKSKIETDAKQRQEFESAIDRPFIAESRQRAQRVQELATKDPQIAGVITDPGVKNALATLVKEGISTPSGAIGVKGIEDAIARANPKIDPAKRAELAGHLNQMQLDYAKLTMKGQGQISDSERELIARAVGSISDPAELVVRRAKLMEARANATEKLADLYGDGSKFRGDLMAFKASPEYKAAVNEYEQRIRAIGEEKISLAKSGKPGPFDDAAKEKAYQEWKKKQGAK